ncbi:TPA: glycosyltransferase [Klebsiella pneumoniae]
MNCLVIIVTHNSQKHIQWCIDGLESAKSLLKIKVIDSGSTNISYLDNISSKHRLEIIKENNIGFVKGNNLALQSDENFDWVLLLNPDARIEGDRLDELLKVATDVNNSNVGIFSVPLVRFSIDEMQDMQVYDSLGIDATRYGRWFDIGSGEQTKVLTKELIDVPAVCGAFMLIRTKALELCLDKSAEKGFESSYYMYKEDIELCLRFKKNDWRVVQVNSLQAFHCRGWNKPRKEISHWAKYHSAKNDVDIALRYRRRFLPYALCKYLWVNLFERFGLM